MEQLDLKNNPVTKQLGVDEQNNIAADALNQANKQLEKTAGAANIHAFDEEQTPEQKKAQAQEALPSTFKGKDTGGKSESMPTDVGTSNASDVAAALDSASKAPVSSSQPAPGAYPTQKSSRLPDWYKVGWTSFSELPNPGEDSKLEEYKAGVAASAQPVDNNEKHQDMLAEFLKESYYGEWYHNAGAILVTVLFTWILARIGSGLMSCLVIGAFLATYYQTSIRRLRRNVRDDVQRELVKARLETDLESVDWLNSLMDKFWLIAEPAISAQVIGTADAILVENTPSFLDSIRLSTFTMGTKGPRIESVKSYPKTDPNVVVMDWKVSFTPNDILDLTKRETQAKVNPKIVLTIRLGKGFISAPMPILVEDISFTGHLRVKLNLFSEFPHVKTVEACFLEQPYFDYVLKPVGGETFGFDINNIPGLQSFVAEQVHANLGPMMYAPNVFTVDVAGMMAGGTDLEAANGVLAITIYSASNIKGNDVFGSVDPYITFHTGNPKNKELARTSAIENTSSPRWNETHFILLNSLNDSLCLNLMDRNVGRKDSSLGIVNMELKELAENENTLEGLNLVALRSGKSVGEIKADIKYFPVAKPNTLEDGTVEPPVASNTGILRFNIHECTGLASGGGGIGVPLIGGSSISTYAKFKLNGKEALKTKVYKRSNSPRWDKFVEVFVADKNKVNLSVDVYESKEFADDTIIASWTSTLVAVERQLVEEKSEWWNMKDGKGKIHVSTAWKPVVMTGLSEGMSHASYSPPIGVVRLHCFGANNLKNVEALTGGKSDPYVRVKSGMQIRGQTEFISDNLDPDWNEVLYVPVHSVREDLILEVMDYNEVTKDKSLGLTDISIKSILKETEGENGAKIYEGVEPMDKNVDLVTEDRKKGKGKLHYNVAFYPTLALAKQVDEKEENKNEEANEEKEVTTQKDTSKVETEVLPERDLHGEYIKYTPDQKIDLLSYESGVLIINVHEVNLPRQENAYAEILLDANDAQYKTAKLKGTNLPFHETADAFVKEMDFARLAIRIKQKKDTDKDDNHIGIWTGQVKDIVRHLRDKKPAADDEDDGQVFDLSDTVGGRGTIKLSFKFVPVIRFKLDPSESLENQGNLTVTPIQAQNLPAVDRSGASDPYLVFILNGEKAKKTEVYKKNLNPKFDKDEMFVLPVPSRISSSFRVEVYDWDQIGKNTLLATGEVPLAGDNVESFAAKDVEVHLNSEPGLKSPSSNATLRLRLLWQPQLLAKKKVGTGFLGATTRAFTGAPGAAFGAGRNIVGGGAKMGVNVVGGGAKMGAQAVGGGAHLAGDALGAGGKVLGGGVNALGSGFKSGVGFLGGGSKNKPKEDVPQPTSIQVPTSANETAIGGNKSSDNDTSSLASINSPVKSRSTASLDRASGEDGTLVITVVAARGLKAMDRGGTSDPYARIRIGKNVVGKTKHIKKTLEPQWNEKFETAVGSGKTLVDIKVKDHNTLQDVDIGNVVLDLWENVQPNKPFQGWLPLSPSGTGEVNVSMEFVR
ncbi:hypothetical protein NQZ79_g602 [Umbelopsis isabellina]|nr:hypothetical protein NQZ79_g602 [Umbelopsis isabellina]